MIARRAYPNRGRVFLFLFVSERVLSQRACDCQPTDPGDRRPALPRGAHTILDGCVARGAAMASAPKPRRTLEATELKKVVAELKQFRFLLALGLRQCEQLQKRMQPLDHRGVTVTLADGNTEPVPRTKQLRNSIQDCLRLALEGLGLVETTADHVATDISSCEIHRVWEIARRCKG